MTHVELLEYTPTVNAMQGLLFHNVMNPSRLISFRNTSSRTKYLATVALRLRLNNAPPLLDFARDVLVLMLQQAERVGRVVPLPLVGAAAETRGEFFG